MRYSRLQMIKSFRSRALRRFWTKSDASGLRHDWVRKVERQLTLLDSATKPEEMDLVTFGFHRLTADQTGRFAVTVPRNWRLTFAFDGQDAVDVDLEDYHGR
ncbi:MAG TPA: type II toxin-antitoxin system RelE/ParE family toxin [Rhodoblastus sp.]|nr:type II toxin-antitoxin system RelE/ParE family toxin [Rhodoblastus sp.]